MVLLWGYCTRPTAIYACLRRDIEEHANGDRTEEDARSSIGDERHGPTSRWEHTTGDSGVDKCVHGKCCGDTGCEESTECIGSLLGYGVASPHDEDERDDEEAYADEAVLFTNNAENEIAIRLGKKPVALSTLPWSNTGNAAIAKRNERLVELISNGLVFTYTKEHHQAA